MVSCACHLGTQKAKAVRHELQGQPGLQCEALPQERQNNIDSINSRFLIMPYFLKDCSFVVLSKLQNSSRCMYIIITKGKGSNDLKLA